MSQNICKTVVLLFIGLFCKDLTGSSFIPSGIKSFSKVGLRNKEEDTHGVFLKDLYPRFVESPVIRIIDDTPEGFPGRHLSLLYLFFLNGDIVRFFQKKGARFQHLYLLYCSLRIGLIYKG